MKHIFQKVIVAATALLLFNACDKDVLNINSDPFKGKTYNNEELASPISTFLTEDSRFSEYVKTLRYAGLFDALNQSSAGVKFTAFVPDNDAMQEFYQRRGVSGIEDLGKSYARQFVLFHTVNTDSILPERFIKLSSVTNLTSDELPIEIDPEHAGEATINGDGHVIEMGLSAFNGKVYVLSKAMTPLVETVTDRIVEAGSSNIMLQALRATKWDEKLSVAVDTTYDKNRNRQINHYYYTLLNVTDAVFAEAGISSFEALKAKLKSNDQQGLTEDSLLRAYVGYHILQNQYTTDELGAFNGTSLTRIWSSSAKNQVFTVTYDSLTTVEADKYIFNAAGEQARFVPEASNILSRNGYIHNLDAWMPIWEPEQTTVIWDLADYAEIKSIIKAEVEKGKDLAYQPIEPTNSEQKTRIAQAACFTYEMGEGGTKNNSYSEIDYATCTKTLKNANNNDRVVFNLGYMGQVSMQTPTIVRGKYLVEMNFVYTSSQSFMRTQSEGNGGLLRIMFDDNDDLKIHKAPYPTVPSIAQGVYSTTLYKEVDFAETAAHKFSFTILDPAASTNKGFSIQIDCIKFIPIQDIK